MPSRSGAFRTFLFTHKPVDALNVSKIGALECRLLDWLRKRKRVVSLDDAGDGGMPWCHVSLELAYAGHLWSW